MQLGDVGPDLVLGRCVGGVDGRGVVRPGALKLELAGGGGGAGPALFSSGGTPFTFLLLSKKKKKNRAKRRRGNGPANLLNPSYRGEDGAKR
jgi:hypothetical protein